MSSNAAGSEGGCSSEILLRHAPAEDAPELRTSRSRPGLQGPEMTKSFRRGGCWQQMVRLFRHDPSLSDRLKKAAVPEALPDGSLNGSLGSGDCPCPDLLPDFSLGSVSVP